MELINCIKKINQKNLKLLFVGGGELEDLMKVQCKINKISAKFVPFLSQKKLGSVYLIADIYVNTSTYDASPKTLNEALCFDIPIIAPNKFVGQANDLIINGKNGYSYEAGNIEQLAKKINNAFKLSKKIINKINTNIILNTHPKVGATNILNIINL